MEPEGCAIFLYIAILVMCCIAACASYMVNVPNNTVQHDTVYVRDTVCVIIKEN